MRLIAELKRRKVFRVAAAYAVVAWGFAQIADLVLENTAAPSWVMQVVLLLLALGFPLTIVLAWAFEVTPDGVKRTASLQAGERPPSMAAQDYLLVTALVALVAVSAFQVFHLQRGSADQATSQTVASVSAGETTRRAGGTSDEEPVSIAVLAFENMSTDAGNEYFADGISEEILNLLAGVEDLSVASRTSAFGFKGKDTPLPRIAEALSVRYVLEGSVRKAGDQVRVTAQLIDAPSDRHLWSDTYDRTLDDIFAIQDEIAAAIGDALQVELLGRSGESVQAKPVDPEVYARFLEARHQLRSRDPESMRAANETLIDVVQREPEFARAHVVLGEAYLLGRSLEIAQPLVPDPVAISQAELHAGIAQRLDPELGGIDLILGSIADDRDHDLVAAWNHYTRAIELEPNEARPYHWRGMLLCRWGLIERGLEDLDRGRALEPDNPNLHFATADCLLSAERPEQAIVMARKGAALRGRQAHELVALTKLRSGDRDGAITEFERVISDDSDPAVMALVINAIKASPQTMDATQLERMAQAGQAAIGVLLELHRYDEVLDSLLSMNEIPTATPGLWSGLHSAVRNDPRFIQLAERLGGFDLWREIGVPADCRPQGESFTCGHHSITEESGS